jgi:glutamate-1-semialdehyde 2,1-aminomutase
MTLRLAVGGLQQHYGIRPDVTALGKIIGGGLPVGAFGGRADVMEVWDPRRPGTGYHAGTFNANPLTLTAGMATMRHLPADAIRRINDAGDGIREAISAQSGELGIALSASGFGSVLQLHPTPHAPTNVWDVRRQERKVVELLFLMLLQRGILIAARGALNLSTAMSDTEFGAIRAGLEGVIESLAEGGALTATA